MTTSIRTNYTSEHLTQATILAQDKLEAMLAAAPVFAAGSDTPRVGFTRTWTVVGDTPQVGVSQIVVSVSWVDHTLQTITVTTVVND